MTQLIEDDELKRHLVDPSELTQTEREALERIHLFRLRRMRRGYGIRGETRITSLAMVNRLMGRNLVRVLTMGGIRTLDTTHRGKETMRLILERRKKYHVKR